MPASVFYTPRWRAIDGNGDPIADAMLEFLEAGTSTPLPVYADVDLDNSLGNEVDADSGGLFPEMFMLPQAYDVNLYDGDGVLVWSAVDFYPPVAASSSNTDITGTAGVSFAVGEGGYLSDGSDGNNAGQWYKWDADLSYASESPQTGFAVAPLTAGESGLFRTSGKVTGLSGLTPGATYFISGTAGAIATSPGTYPRLVGQAESTTVLVVQTNPPPALTINAPVNGRLTLTTGTPVTSADVTAAGTLYFTPYLGNQIALYTGNRWTVVGFTELSIAIPAAANQVYDVFIDYNDGTPQITLTAWTNDTTRATALTRQNGIYVLTGDTQKRYVGSIRTITAAQVSDSVLFRHVWNYYNRVPRYLRKVESTSSWTYTLAAFQQANASAANQVDVCVGLQEALMDLSVIGQAGNSTANIAVGLGIGEDSATTKDTLCVGGVSVTDDVTISSTQFHVALRKYPPIGRHYYTWLENSAATGTTTWFSNGANGLTGWIQG